jgi:hypothetical protein
MSSLIKVRSGRALSNFSLTFAKALLVIMAAIFILISPKKADDEGVKPKVEYMISMEWPGDLNYDVDLWVKTPSGKVVYYANREAGFVSLERDVLGWTNQAMLVGDKTVTRTNQEVITLRGIEPGEYVVNVHYYSAPGFTSLGGETPPFPVSVRLERLNPRYELVTEEIKPMHTVRKEVHMFRFTLDEKGNYSGVNDLRPVDLRQSLPKQ